MSAFDWNTSGSVSSDYNNAANWLEGGTSAATAPGPADAATIGGGATVVEADALDVGDPAGESGSLTITGAQTDLTVESSVAFGKAGSGTLSVLDGASLVDTDPYDDNFTIGGGGGGTGDLIVDGRDCVLTASYYLLIGHNGGTGSAEVGNGGLLQAQGEIDIGAGHTGTGSGTATVSAGGTLKAALTPSDLGSFTDGPVAAIALGLAPGTTGTLNVTGAGALVDTNGNKIAVGAYNVDSGIAGGTGDMSVSLGATVDSGAATSTDEALEIASSSANTGTVTVKDAGSTVNAKGAVIVGDAGDGHLAVESGALLNSGQSGPDASNGLIIANLGGTSDVTVSGAGSKIVNLGRFSVGGSGVGSLTIADGGDVTTDESGNAGDGADIGYAAGSSGSAVSVSGAGSSWSVAGSLEVGVAGDGSMKVADDGTVSAQRVDVGVGSGVSGTVTLSGGSASPAALSCADALNVGVDGSGDVALTDSASAQVGSVTLGANADAKATLDLSSGSILDVAGAMTDGLASGIAIAVDDSTISTSGGMSLTEGPSTSLAATDDSTVSGGLTLGIGATADFDETSMLEGPVTFSGGGTLTVSTALGGPLTFDGGTLNVAPVAGATTPIAFDGPIIVSGGTLASPGSIIGAPDGNGGYDASLGGTIDFDSNSVLRVDDATIAGPIVGFDATDRLILNNFAGSAAPDSASWADNVLSLSANGAVVETLSLVGNYSSSTFAVAADMNGYGVDVTLSTGLPGSAGSIGATGTSVTDADTVAIDPNAAFFGNGLFGLTGTATSAAGVKSVEITAEVDGVEKDLGAATLGADGTFGFVDHVGAHMQGFITATETDGAGGTASVTPPTSLRAGIRGQSYVARQDFYTPDGSAYTATAYEKDDGSRTVDVKLAGQTLYSQYFDTFANQAATDTTFVFNPGFGNDTIENLLYGGPDHDTVALPSADFASFAQVLHDTQNTPNGAVIHDNTSGDTILLAGVTKTELAHHKADVSFRA